MGSIVRVSFLAALIAGGLAPAASTAESYDNCVGFIDGLPAVITVQGTWCLRQDLSTSTTPGAAIRVSAPNVTVDCNGFKIGGLSAGGGTQAMGIDAPSTVNVTVRNCTVRGFKYGIRLDGAGALIEDNRLDQNTFAGIWAGGGGGSLVRRNMVMATGGPLWDDPRGIYASDQVNVTDNIVSGVTSVGGPAGSNAFGIIVNRGLGAVTGNTVSGVVARSGATAYGIDFSNQVRVALVGNHILGNGTGAALTCGGGGAGELVRARDNLFIGFPVGLNACGDAGGNELTP
jgi:hypothetical protein